MNRKLFLYTAGGFLFTSLAGSALHFAYEYSGYNPFVGMFAPVSESVWEHMKLVFFPSLLFLLPGWPFFRNAFPAYITAFLTGILTGTLAIPIAYYTYSGILGASFLSLDILSFLLCVLLDYYLSFQLCLLPQGKSIPPVLVVFLTVALMTGFFFFTFQPPDTGIFSLPATS